MVTHQHSVQCQSCQGFFVAKKKGKNKFCSKQCYFNFIQYKSFEYICIVCNKRFYTSRVRNDRIIKYCSRNCWLVRSPHQGNVCKQCGYAYTSIRYRMYNGVIRVNEDRRLSKFCSYQCHHVYMRENPQEQAIRRTRLAGDKNPLWKGMETILSHDYRGPNWLGITAKIRKREHYCCKRCGISEIELQRKLDIHHIEPWFNFTDYRKANRLNNLEALCPSCHRSVERRNNTQLCMPFWQGKHGRRLGTMSPIARFSAQEIVRIRNLAENGNSYRSIARDYHTTHGLISKIVRRATYRDVP